MKKDKKFNVFTPLNGKRSRKSKKFPRAKINVEEHENYSMRGSHIKCGDFIEADERFPYVRRNEICRYINSRLGENLDDERRVRVFGAVHDNAGGGDHHVGKLLYE